MTRSLIVWGLYLLVAVGGFLALELPAVWGAVPWKTFSTTSTFLIRKTGPVGAALFIAILAAGMAILSEHFVNPEVFDKRRQKKVRKARETLAKHGELGAVRPDQPRPRPGA